MNRTVRSYENTISELKSQLSLMEKEIEGLKNQIQKDKKEK